MNRSGIANRLRQGALGALMALLGLGAATSAATPPFGASRIAPGDGNPTLLVDGQPFFFYGAAFFYERIPAAQWRPSMLALRALGFNTLDLYVPWNWHELADGAFDFDGHSNSRRNLRGVLDLARELQFKLIVRPGPVIRNEWRNGGYPAWLLDRPEYGMPLHDVLEGRYPATATLQNANSDDAAAQWLANATHLRYAGRWLRTVLHEFIPVADLVIAVQIDDDQGAYIDNQTWPAPHFQAYLRVLEADVREVVGAQLPVFINTFEMKVTASAPVWAMGNWYQSDAYSIGEHDRTALEFSAGLLQTQTRYPLAMSEFQAGWLAAPEDPAPRLADPTNTTLALHTLLGFGMRGVIDFPAQDTRNPAGWEAPFANASYAWNAALRADLTPSDRYAPTAAFGALVEAYGSELAAAHRLADGAIAYLTSATDETRLTNANVFAVAARTQTAQQQCRAAHFTCDLVDLRFIGDDALQRYPFLIVPDANSSPMVAAVTGRLARYRSRGGLIVGAPPLDITARAGGIADATVLFAADGAAFLDIVNYDVATRRIPPTRIALPDGRVWRVGPFNVTGRRALLLREDAAGAVTAAPTPVPVDLAPEVGYRVDAASPAALDTNPSKSLASGPVVDFSDSEADGYPRLRFANDFVTLSVAPAAGARAFSFHGRRGACESTEAFTSVGALRDDTSVQPPLSITDRIGKYTRSFPAGMFNRTYTVRLLPSKDRAAATFSYAAPDAVPAGARFERTVTMTAAQRGFTVEERVTFADGAGSQAQRAVRYDSIDTRGATIVDERVAGSLGVIYGGERTRCLAVIAWRPAEVKDAQLTPERTSTVVRLQFTAGRSSTMRYALEPLAPSDDVRALLLKERTAVGAKG